MPRTTRTTRTLGELERAVMEQLWARSESTGAAGTPAGTAHGTSVREVHEALSVDRELAYTTVMTVLDRLSRKDFVTRERDGRAWRYLPAASREELTGDALRETVAGLDRTDRRAAMLHFLDGASPEELADVRAALAEVEAAAGRRARD